GGGARGRDRLGPARRGVARGSDQRLLAARLAEQRPEAPPELAAGGGSGFLSFVGAHAAFLSFGRRPISSRARAMYARLPMHAWSYINAVSPWLGASEDRTIRGMTASDTSLTR